MDNPGSLAARSIGKSRGIQFRAIRRRGKISASTWGFVAPWLDGVIPFGMERIAFDVERRYFCIADLDAFFVGVGVEFAADSQALLGRGRRDQLDDRRLTRERPTAPVLGDMAEQAVLDLVPLRRAGRIVANADGQSRLVGQLLQFDFPEPNPRTVGASTVGGDHRE